jgi:hypothetical protein
VKKLTVILFAVSCCIWLLSFRCEKGMADAPVFFDGGSEQHAVAAGIIDEASGLADSYANPGFLWVNEDSQRPTAIHLLERNGQYRKKIFIKNVTNRDWEEIALADGPTAGRKYLYIAETGDNDQVYAEYSFYRFEEPMASVDTIFQADVIRFKYPDGSHDSEAFFVDPATKDIYVITKREAKSRIYKIAFPQSTTGLNTASFVVELPYNMVTAASYSSQGELIVKNYSEVYYYKRGAGQSVADMFYPGITKLTYAPEPQGEAVAFAADNSGYFTISEKGFAPSVKLIFYKRK